MKISIAPGAERFFTRQKARGEGKTDVDSDFWPLLQEKFEIGAEARRPFEQRWLVNLAFLTGRQYVFFNSAADLLQHLAARKGRRRIVDNKILPRFQKQVSRLIRNHPLMSVIPNSTEQKDIQAAKVGDKVLKWFWRQQKMRRKIRQLGGWIYSTGNGYLDDRWNPGKGPIVYNEKAKRLEYTGDVECGVWSPFEIGVPSGSLNDPELDEMPWVVKSKFRELSWIASNLPRGELVQGESAPEVLAATAGIFGLRDGAPTLHKVEGAVVHELEMKPCGEFPNGLFLVGANGIICVKQDYPFGFFNLEHFKDIDVPGCFLGMSTTEAAIWLQKIQNRTVSSLVEFNDQMAKGKWLSPRKSNLSAAPDDTHGQVMYYDPVMGIKPEMVMARGVPNSYQMVLQLVAAGMMELYHQHEVTQGTNKSDIRSGEMVALLLEQDDFGNVPTHAVFEEGLENLMGRVLKRIQKGYDKARVVQIAGPDGEFEVFSFKGADLGDNTDVHVTKESSLPDSKVARQFAIMERYEKGLYGMPQEPGVRERVLRMLREVPDEIQDIYKEDYLDRQNAKMENLVLMENPLQELLINTYDNHMMHLEEHHFARKQSDYQKVKYNNRNLFAAREVGFMKHEMGHQKFVEMMLKQQQAAMVAEKGGSGARK